MLRSALTVALVVMLMVGGCTSGDDSATEAPTASTTIPTTVLATTPTTAVATTTTAPSTTTSTIPELTLPSEGEPWDLAYVSNSFGWGVAEPYAVLAADALGVPVNPHEATIDHLEAWRALEHLQDVRYPPLADLVRNAEIIVVYGVPERSGDWAKTCWPDGTNRTTPPPILTEDDWQQYRDELETLFAAVWELRRGLPTVIRTFDAPIGMISEWRELGIDAGCITGWESNSATVRAAAEVHGITMVSLFDLFNGPNHDEDPREKGWIRGDGYHANEAGAAAIADALAAAGFEPTTQP